MPDVSGGIHADQLLALARGELNTCPICWMPLYIGDGGDEADKWCQVQVLFKNKPSEVTENKFTSERNRPSNVFGMPYSPDNCNAAHFIHRSSQGRNLFPWDNIWQSVQGAGVSGDVRIKMEQDIHEPEKSSEFFSLVCLGKGLFDGDDGSDQVSAFVRSFSSGIGFNFLRSERTLVRLLSVFAGCKDCNSKMTINLYTRELFDLVFPPSFYKRKHTPSNPDASDNPGPKKRRYDEYSAKFETDNCFAYLMLSGLLCENELVNEGGTYNGYFTVSEKERRETWQFRVIFIWCQLQILFCRWRLSSLNDLFEHHVGYIYSGTADLYVSFILYAMYCASTRMGSARANIDFGMFHYFYSSLYPQFVRNRVQAGVKVPHNLSDMILNGQGSADEWSCPFSCRRPKAECLAIVRRQLAEVCKRVLEFWRCDFINISEMIHCQVEERDYPGEVNQRVEACARYFTSYANSTHIITTFNHATHTRDSLNLQTSVAVLTPRIYWLHFNYITLPSIRAACGRCDSHYDRRTPVEKQAYQSIWRWWYTRFLGETQALLAGARPCGGEEKDSGGAGVAFPVLRSADLASRGGEGRASWLGQLLALVERLGVLC